MLRWLETENSMLGNLAVFELKGLLPAWLLATLNKPLPPEAYKTSKPLQRNPESLKPKTLSTPKALSTP